MLFRAGHFIQYHNAFTIIFMVLFVGFGAAFAASPDFREGVAGALVSSEETIQSIDNSQILAVDLDNFSFSLQIEEITEDEGNYYVFYSYTTIVIQNGAWNVVEKEKTFTVSKKALGERDLGLYVTEELGEVIDSTLVYLKKVQKIEREKGTVRKVVTTQYAGLIGKFLNPKEKVFPGYEPVVQESEPEVISQQSSDPETILQTETIQKPSDTSRVVERELIDKALIREIVLELLAQEQIQQSLSVVPICQPTAEVCDGLDNNCDGLVDEGGVCEIIVPPPTEPPVEELPAEEPVADIIAPVITLIGPSAIDLTTEDTYTDEGATATDDIDGDITANIVTVNPVDTTLEGTYIVTYNVADAAGNAANEVTRTVTVTAPAVVDTTSPVITLIGQATIELTVGDTYTDEGATATDDIDGDITASITTDNLVDTSIAGTYTVVYTVSDSAGNAATPVERTVNVIEPSVETSSEPSAE